MTNATRMQERCAKLLAQREAELWEQLAAAAPAVGDEGRDFKEMAARETAATLQQAMERQATGELAQVVAARQRLQQARWGRCVDCGEPIDPRRLLALPFTSHCTDCQAWSEARTASAAPGRSPAARAAGADHGTALPTSPAAPASRSR